MKFFTDLPIITISILLLTACGGSSPDEKENKSTDSSSHSSSISSHSPKSKKATLSISPIDMEAAFYNGPAEYTKISPCPFLTDKTAEGTYKMLFGLETKKQERLEVSNTGCRWSYFDVRIPSEKNVAYRMNQIDKYDGEQALQPQDGPGKKAFLYYPKLLNKKKLSNPSGFIFTQVDKTIFISGSASSEPTSTKKLREIADEIANLLPNAPKIKEQRRQLIERFDVCSIWDKQALQDLLETDNLHYALNSGKSSCRYVFRPKEASKTNSSQFEFRFSFENNSGKQTACDSRIKKGDKLLKDFSHKVVSRIYKSNTSIDPSFEEFVACFDRGNFHLSISGSDLRYAKQARLLIKNILSRVGSK